MRFLMNKALQINRIQNLISTMKPGIIQLGPKLGETEISEIEQQIGITLPLGYRLFLQRIGNGGSGPMYGLRPIEQVIQNLQNDLRENFYAWAGPEIMDQDDVVPSLFQGEPAIFWEQEYGANWKTALEDPFPTLAGYLVIGQWYATNVLLLMNGPQRGHIWYDDRADSHGSGPAEPSRFLDWYEHWLNSTLTKSN